MIAWVFDREALGPPPDGVELADEPGPDVEFAVVRGWEDLRALEGLSPCASSSPLRRAWTGSSTACPRG